MRVRYIRDSDLGVVESTVNLLLSQNWEFYREIQVLPEGDYLVTMLNYDRPSRGPARAEDLSRPTRTPASTFAGGCSQPRERVLIESPECPSLPEGRERNSTGG